MYNGKKILELLAERNLKQKDLLEALQTRENGSVSRFVKETSRHRDLRR